VNNPSILPCFSHLPPKTVGTHHSPCAILGPTGRPQPASPVERGASSTRTPSWPRSRFRHLKQRVGAPWFACYEVLWIV
jgi:hypothetical protein